MQTSTLLEVEQFSSGKRLALDLISSAKSVAKGNESVISL
jgi:hypothetical protein